MEGPGPATNSSCTCNLQFGVYPLSFHNFQTLNVTKELSNPSVNFHGPAGESQRILAIEKIEEIKQKVADYYYDRDCKVIAIPNHFVKPKKPTVLGTEGKEKEDVQFLDKYLEEQLHHKLVNAARMLKMEAFIMNNFHSGDCIQQLVQKGKDTRGKDFLKDFNQHEIRIKEILDIKDIPREKLDLCIEEHCKWKENKLKLKNSKSWLFKKECFIINARSFEVLKDQGGSNKNIIENLPLYKIPISNIEKFYSYQYFNYCLQENKTEWDSLIIVPEHSAIINIEVKLGPKDRGDKLKLLKNASDQTKQHFNFMQKLTGGMLSKDWVFVKAACVPYLTIFEEATIPCVNCQQFILQENDVDNVKHWLEKIFQNKFSNPDICDQAGYEKLTAELIFNISIKESSRFNQLISDTFTVSKEVEKALTGKTDGISLENSTPMYMLNNEQLQAVNSLANFFIIDGDYGTGKTYVLKERAKKCATNNLEDKIFYIDLTTITNLVREVSIASTTSVMFEMAKVDFESYPNVKVISFRDLEDISPSKIIDGLKRGEIKEIINAINQFLAYNLCDHLFIDEMIIGRFYFPGSLKTVCMTLKVYSENADYSTTKRKEWIETMIKNHNARYFNLTKNLRNSNQICKFSEAFNSQISTKLPDSNVIGGHNYYYNNIYDISPGLLAFAAIKKYFLHEPQEGVVVLTYTKESDKALFDLLKKHFSSTRPVVSDFKAFLAKPEGILVTSLYIFQGAQARNIIIIDDARNGSFWIRNMILRAMSFAIVISRKNIPVGNKFGVIVDENLHAERISIDCHHYHNKDKYDMNAITMAIFDKYKLLDQEKSILIVTFKKISSKIIEDANTKEFINLSREERKIQVEEKIELEGKELYEELKRNVSEKYETSWSYNDNYVIEDVVNKPRHINYINISLSSKFVFNKADNIIVFADKNSDQNHEFAAWGNKHSLNYSENETSKDIVWSLKNRNRCEAQSRDLIWEAQPKFAIIVHDGKIETFSQPQEALNLIKDDNLHRYIPLIPAISRKFRKYECLSISILVIFLIIMFYIEVSSTYLPRKKK